MSETEISGSLTLSSIEEANKTSQKKYGYFIKENRKQYVISIYEKILKLLKIVSFERRKNILKMFDEIGLTFFSAPASSRIDYHSCFPGGLARHSLFVMKNMIKLIDKFQIQDYDKESIILVALFHDLGKIGNGEEEYYLPQDDSYWKRRGYLYKINERLAKIPVNIISLYLLQKYNINVSFKEYESLYSITNKGYTFKEEYNLTPLLQWSDMWAVMEEKKERVDVTSDSQTFEVQHQAKESDEISSLEEGKINFDEVSTILDDEQ